MLKGEIESKILSSNYFSLFIQEKQNELAKLAEATQDTIDGRFWYFYSRNQPFSKDQLDDFANVVKNELGYELEENFRKVCYYRLFFSSLGNYDSSIEEIENIIAEAMDRGYLYLRIKALITLARRYIWQGREDKAFVILSDTHLLLEKMKLPEVAEFDCCFRLHYQTAQVYRHKGSFYQARLEIQKSIWLAMKIRNVIRISMAMIVKVGIETEWLIELPHELKNEVRKEIKIDVDTITALAEEFNLTYIQEVVKVAKYQYLKTSIRNRDRVDAERLIMDSLRAFFFQIINLIQNRLLTTLN